jgi:hypothetical protein
MHVLNCWYSKGVGVLTGEAIKGNFEKREIRQGLKLRKERGAQQHQTDYQKDMR